MADNREDILRATIAAKAIIDGRRLDTDDSGILVTLEHAVTTVLIALYPDPRQAAAMLNEGLTPGIEQRLAWYSTRKNASD